MIILVKILNIFIILCSFLVIPHPEATTDLIPITID